MRLSRRSWAAVATALTALLVWAFLPQILNSAATLWIVDERPAHATAIVILGGGSEFRPSAAAGLYHEGWAPLVLVPNVEPSPLEQLGMEPSQAKFTIELLERLKVPRAAVELYGTEVTSTRDEAEALKEWAHGKAVARLLIPTDAFHARRVKWVFGKLLPGIEVRVIPVETPEYDPIRWWQQEEGLIAFQNEIIKWLYYHAKY